MCRTSAPLHRVVKTAPTFNWTNIVANFELAFKQTFSTDRKAHFDNLPDEFSTVDGAKLQWSNLLLLDALIYILKNDGFNHSTRRAFNQHMVLYDCILQELKRMDTKSYDTLAEEKKACVAPTEHNKETKEKYANLALVVLDNVWRSMDQLESHLLSEIPASKARNKYPIVVRLLTKHEVFAAHNYNLHAIQQTAISKAMFLFNPAKAREPAVYKTKKIREQLKLEKKAEKLTLSDFRQQSRANLLKMVTARLANVSTEDIASGLESGDLLDFDSLINVFAEKEFGEQQDDQSLPTVLIPTTQQQQQQQQQCQKQCQRNNNNNNNKSSSSQQHNKRSSMSLCDPMIISFGNVSDSEDYNCCGSNYNNKLQRLYSPRAYTPAVADMKSTAALSSSSSSSSPSAQYFSANTSRSGGSSGSGIGGVPISQAAIPVYDSNIYTNTRSFQPQAQAQVEEPGSPSCHSTVSSLSCGDHPPVDPATNFDFFAADFDFDDDLFGAVAAASGGGVAGVEVGCCDGSECAKTTVDSLASNATVLDGMKPHDSQWHMYGGNSSSNSSVVSELTDDSCFAAVGGVGGGESPLVNDSELYEWFCPLFMNEESQSQLQQQQQQPLLV